MMLVTRDFTWMMPRRWAQICLMKCTLPPSNQHIVTYVFDQLVWDSDTAPMPVGPQSQGAFPLSLQAHYLLRCTTRLRTGSRSYLRNNNAGLPAGILRGNIGIGCIDFVVRPKLGIYNVRECWYEKDKPAQNALIFEILRLRYMRMLVKNIYADNAFNWYSVGLPTSLWIYNCMILTREWHYSSLTLPEPVTSLILTKYWYHLAYNSWDQICKIRSFARILDVASDGFVVLGAMLWDVCVTCLVYHTLVQCYDISLVTCWVCLSWKGIRDYSQSDWTSRTPMCTQSWAPLWLL